MRSLLIGLVGLFPGPFREQFGRDMVEQVGLDYDGACARGRLAALRFTLATGLDLLSSGIAERWNPTWVGRRRPPVKGQHMLSEWTADLRHAARALRRTPGFTLMAAGTLALAIGANAGLFGVVQAVLLNPLPYGHPDRLVSISGTAPGSDFPERFGLSPEFYLQYREESRLLEDVATYNSFTSTLRTEDRVERIRMSAPANSLYSTLGARPVLGRLPVPEDENRVVVISDALWRSWFGGDPSVVGRSFEIAGQSRQVIGVMAPEFKFPNDGTLLWIANEIRPEGLEPGRFGLRMVARMAPGATPAAVANELTTVARRLPQRFGGSPTYARLIDQHRAIVTPLLDDLMGSASWSLWLLLGSVAIVLLIACANVANLFLVRAEGRSRDLAVRRAIGATRRQVIRLQLTEALIVAVLAGALGILLAALTLPFFLQAAPAGIPRLDEVGLDLGTLAFTLVAALFSGLACGVLPALRASASDVARLRDGGRGSTRRRRWTRNALVVGQTALALVLLTGSSLLLRSFQALRQVDPGYDTRDVFTFQFAPEQEGLTDGPTWARFHLDFLTRLAALPGVTSVGLVENVPLNEGTRADRFRTEEMANDADAGTLLNFTWTAGDYFRTMSIDLVHGRVFDTTDQLATPGNVVVSRKAASLLWPGQNPLGRRLQVADGTAWHTVVGVVEDVMQEGFRETPQALVYYPLVGPTPESWAISSPAYVVKTARAEVIAPEIRELVRQVAPEAPMYRTFTMAGLAADSMAELSFTLLTLGFLSLLALILGAVGLYGVLSHVVAERTREIGVRLAFGATAAQVRGLVVAQATRVVFLGVMVGIAVAVASGRALTGLLFGIAALDPPTFAAVSVSMLGVGLVASYLPARRASMVDPIDSLKGD